MLVGYRAWLPEVDNIGDPILKSFVADYRWEGPVAEGSKPLKDFGEEDSFTSSERDEGYGFFSLSKFFHLSNMLFDEDMQDSIMGVVQPYGLIQRHRDGFRSQRAQVVALCSRVKCALARCDESVDAWIVHANNVKMTGVCSNHLGVLNTAWMKTLCGDNPRLIDHNEYIQGLAKRYHCEILDYNEFKKAEEYYGSR
jgi:hypothetical protein